MTRIVRHVRGNLVAYIALFFALSSGSYAAAAGLLPQNSVGTEQVINHSLLSQDFKLGQLPKGKQGKQGKQGIPGTPGAKGDKGDKGDTGAAGATNVVMRQGNPVTVNVGSFSKAEAQCNAGERATGGGVYNESNVYYPRIVSSYPTPNPTTEPPTGNGGTPTGWRVWMATDGGNPITVYAYVICAAP